MSLNSVRPLVLFPEKLELMGVVARHRKNEFFGLTKRKNEFFRHVKD